MYVRLERTENEALLAIKNLVDYTAMIARTAGIGKKDCLSDLIFRSAQGIY